MAKATLPLDLETIDRLEEKVKLLVGVVNRLRADQARSAEENQRLGRELDSLRARLAESEGRTGEVAALVQERDLIRTRVATMLQQLEALSL